MDNILLSVANDYTNMVAFGFSKVTIDDSTGTITVKLTDGSSASWTFPKPANGKDGLGIKSVNVELVTVDDKQEYHLIVTYSDDSTYDAGKFPEQIINISKEKGNALKKSAVDGGLFVPASAVEYSKDEKNIAKPGTDGGIFVPATDLTGYAKSDDVVAIQQKTEDKGKALVIGEDGKVVSANIINDDKLTNTEIKMLGWNVPDECPIKNEISGNQFIQKVGRVDIGTFYWMYRASDGFMTTNYQVPSKTIAETDTPKAYCDIYKALPRSGAVSITNTDKSFALPNKYIVIHDSTYTDAKTFMDNVKGVYVYYELETPIVKKIDGNEGLITREILEGQKLNKISMEGEFNIWTDGDDARIDYEDNYFIMEGDYITIHNNAGNASKITMNDGDIKLEGCPDAGTTTDAMIHLGTNDGTTSYIDMTSDTLKFNGSDIATIDALQPVWISNLMSDAIVTSDRTEAELKLLSRQIWYVLEHYNFMVLKCFIDDGNETLIRNVATSASSGDGYIVCPILTEGNYRKVYEYMLLGDEVHCICLSFIYDKSTKVLHFSIAPCWNAGTSTSWAYNTQYDAIVNITNTFSEVTIEKMGGFIPYTSNKTIQVN